MKTNTFLTLRCSLTLAASGFILGGCERPKESASAAQQAELDAARAQAAADKLAAQELRDEAERLRAEAELRQRITKLAESAEAPQPAPVEPGKTPAPEPEAKPLVNTTTLADTPLPYVRDDTAYQPFYNDLANDGSWMESTDYGYVWQPAVCTDETWAPYTDGGWSYTDYGWAWETQESFGHICYHYGRWIHLRRIGWVWVPGREWAPAWVSWRSGGDCIGWAPLPPCAGWHEGLGIHSWVDGVCHISPATYVFVTVQNFGHPSCKQVLFPKNKCEELFHGSKNVTNLTQVRSQGRGVMVKNEGPALDLVKSKLGERFRERKIEFAERGADRPRVQPSKDPNHLVMGQWTFKGPGSKPGTAPVVKRKLEGGLEERAEMSAEQKAAFHRVVAAEANQALREMPLRKPAENNDRGPRGDVNHVRPVEISKGDTNKEPNGATSPNRQLPPVQTRLEPFQKPKEPEVAAEVPRAKPVREQEHGSQGGNNVAPGNPGAGKPAVAENDSRVSKETNDRQQRNMNNRPGSPAEVAGQPAATAPQRENEVSRNNSARDEEAARQQNMLAQQKRQQQEQAALAEQQQQAEAKAKEEAARREALSRMSKEEQERQLRMRERIAHDEQAAQLAQQQAKQQRDQVEQEASRKQKEEMERQRRMRERIVHDDQAAQQTAQTAQKAQQQQQQAARDLAAQQQAAKEMAAKQREQDQRQAEMAQRRNQEESTRKQQQELAQRQSQMDAARKQQEEVAQQKAQHEAMQRQQAEVAQRQAQQEAMRRQQEDQAQRQAQQEALRRQHEEVAQKQAQQEAMQRQQEDARRRQQEQAERQAQEAARRQQEEANRRAQEDANRKAQEERNKQDNNNNRPRGGGR